MHRHERTATTAPNDEAIREIARQIQHAIGGPPPDDHTTWILSVAAELAPADEDRVIAALARLDASPSELAG